MDTISRNRGYSFTQMNTQPDPNAVKPELKPCPFCGNYPEYCLNFPKNLIELACRECNARFAIFIEAKYFETNGKDFLSTRWNRRASSVEEECEKSGETCPECKTGYFIHKRECKTGEIESLRKELEVCREALDYAKSFTTKEDVLLKINSALAKLSESKEEPKTSMYYPITEQALEASREKKSYDAMNFLKNDVPILIGELESKVEKLTKDNKGLKSELENYRSLAEQVGAVNTISERDQLKAEVEKLSHDNEFYIFSLNNIKSCGDGWSKSIATQTLECVPNSWEGCKSPIGDKAWWTLAQEQNVENAVIKIHYEDADRDLKNMWESVQRTQHENLDLKRSNDQLRAEQSQLKEKLALANKTLNKVRYGFCKTEDIINTLSHTEALYTYQEQSAEITAEQALEWLFNNPGFRPWPPNKNYDYYVTDERSTVYEIISEGKTPLGAIRSAMQKEKEGK